MFLLENKDARGAFNLTAPEVVTMQLFAQELGRVLKKPSWMHVPAFIIKIMMGQMGKEMILSGQKVIPKRLMESGFKFQFSQLHMALTNIYNF
jgi:NAD dependent epimerase/dehydratase family enzyme